MKSRVGRYEIRSQLGKGGMAVVYRAYDPTFMREVAVKVLPAILVDQTHFRHRFQREARALASLEHSAIVPVYDYGESDNDPFLVMRLMRGGTLADRLQRGPLSVTDAIRVLGRISGALDKIHGHKVVHRDLKPSNILFDEDGKAYLTDFGIVKLLEARMELTATLDFLGTPAYMSPEQIGGQVTLDARSDVYSLGVMLYEMLTGDLPYLADTPIKLAQMHLSAPVPRILEANPNLPPGCEPIIQTAMAKNRNDRYWTAEEMVVALADAVAAQKATPGSPDSPQSEVDSRRITETLAPTELLSREEREGIQALAPAETSSDGDVYQEIPPHADVSGSKSTTPGWTKILVGVLLLGLIGAGIIWGIGLSRESVQAAAEAEMTGTAVALAQLTATGQSIMDTTATAEVQLRETAVAAMTQQATTATQTALIPTEVVPTNTSTPSPEPTEPPGISVCADFSGFEPGTSVEGLGTVHPYLDIQSEGNVVALQEGFSPSPYRGTGGEEGELSGGMSEGGFADIQRIHDYRFLVASGITLNQFSLQMLDYGDINPDAVFEHQVSLIAYDVNGAIVDSDALIFVSDGTINFALAGDAITADPGEPGNYTFTVSGNDIVRLELQFLSDGESIPSDLNFGLTELCFEAVGEPLETSTAVPAAETPSPTPTQVAPTPTSTPTPPPAPVTSATQPAAPSCVVVNMTRTEWPNRAFDDVHMSWSNVPPGTDRLSLVVTGIIDGEEAYVVHPTFSDPDTPYSVELWMFESRGFSPNSTFTFVIEAQDANGSVLCTTRGTFDQ